jgi:PPM family protein phosphatase
MGATADAGQALRPDGAMRTDPGTVRPVNEDSVSFVVPLSDDPAAAQGSLLLVADGMGGHAAGEVASALAAQAVRRVYYECAGSVPRVLGAAFEAAHRAIHDWVEQNPDCKGMGTTCTVIAVRDGQAWLAHIGDSRAYLLRNGILTQLSDDQTLVAQLVREGKLSPEEAHNSPVSNVILQALGTQSAIAPTIWSDPLNLAQQDTIVLCTDGLTGVVPDDVIERLVGRLPPIEACEALIEAAVAAGAPDNVSVGVFRMVNASEQPDEQEDGDPTRTMRRLELAEAEATGQSSIGQGSTGQGLTGQGSIGQGSIGQGSAQTRKLKLTD